MFICNTKPLASNSHVRVPVVSLGACAPQNVFESKSLSIYIASVQPPPTPSEKIEDGASGYLRHDYLIKYAYFDKNLFRMICFYQ